MTFWEFIIFMTYLGCLWIAYAGSVNMISNMPTKLSHHRKPPPKAWHMYVTHLSFDFSVVIMRHRVDMSIVPLRWGAWGFYGRSDRSMSPSPYEFQWWGGPFHVWSMQTDTATFEFAFSLSHNWFQGKKLPPKSKD